MVITAGIPTRPGQSRLDVNNADVIRAIMARLDTMAPDAVVLIVTNPVDVLTRLAQNSLPRPWRLIIGAGTVLDTARLRRGLAATLGLDPHNTHVHVLRRAWRQLLHCLVQCNHWPGAAHVVPGAA